MTFETKPKQPADQLDDVEDLHEFAVNQLGYDTEDVLVVGREEGRITVEIDEDIVEDDEKRVRQLIADLSEDVKDLDYNDFDIAQLSDLADLKGWLDRLQP